MDNVCIALLVSLLTNVIQILINVSKCYEEHVERKEKIKSMKSLRELQKEDDGIWV